jgi:ankyrin repeat protein
MNMNKVYEEEYILEYLSNNEDSVSCVNINEDTLLHMYTAKKYGKVQDLILELRPDIIHDQNRQGQTALFNAIDARNEYLVAKIVEIDSSVLLHTDEDGMSPLYYEFTTFGNADIMKILLPYAVELYDADSILDMFGCFFGSLDKVKYMLKALPWIYDYRSETMDTVLHLIVSQGTQARARTLVEHVHKMHPELFTVVNMKGQTPAHMARDYNMLNLIYKLCPESILMRDVNGKIPLHSSHHMYASNTICIDLIRDMPEVLKIQDNNGLTVVMHMISRLQPYLHTALVSELFKLCPESFLLLDNTKRSFVHHITMYKNTNWHSACTGILAAYPYMLFWKDSVGKTPLDYATEDIGGYGSFKLAREIFIATCLKFTAIPEKYWCFDTSCSYLTKSFGHILARSQQEASWAMEFLPEKDKTLIHTILLADMPADIKTKIIASHFMVN